MMTHRRTYTSKLNKHPLRENDEFGIKKVIEYYRIHVTDETSHEPQQLSIKEKSIREVKFTSRVKSAFFVFLVPFCLCVV